MWTGGRAWVCRSLVCDVKSIRFTLAIVVDLWDVLQALFVKREG